MQQKLEQLKSDALTKIQSLANEQEIIDYRNEIVGKSWILTEILKWIKDLSVEEKQTIGKLSNDIKVSILEAFDLRLNEIKKIELEQKLANDFFDVTIPSKNEKIHIHPLTKILNDIYNTFERMWYEIIDNSVSAPKLIFDIIETKNTPFKCVNINKVESWDNSYLQLDWIFVDKNINLWNLKYVIKNVISDLFDIDAEIILKPWINSFLEPALSIEFVCPFCNDSWCVRCNNTWKIDFITAWLINSQILTKAWFVINIYWGLLFSFSINKLAALKYGITDINYLNELNLDFLRQF